MKKILDHIHEKTKSNYKGVYADGKLVNNVANMGANIGSHAIVFRDSGEYNKFTVEILSKVQPLFTDYRICRSIEFIHDNELIKAIKILCIEDECIEYGNDCIYYVIEQWFNINNIDLNLLNDIIDINNYDKKKIPDNNKLYCRLKIQRHDPINYPLRIIGLGETNKGCTVVPENWMGREFKSGQELHMEMNKLEWRKNKPPVKFCCIYSMNLLDSNVVRIHYDNIQTYMENINTKIIVCKLDGKKIKTYISDCNNIDMNVYRNFELFYEKKNNNIICYSPNIFNNKAEYINQPVSVSVLASRLQKCIRRGSGGSKVLYDTIYQMNQSKYYNLPDQKFAKVSGTRQMFWRSYISIIEEICGYCNPNMYDLMDILIISYICHIFPDLQLNSKYMDGFAHTMLNIQYSSNKWNWRNGQLVDASKFKTYGYNYDEESQFRIIDSMIFALEVMPMMSGDRKMLTKCINLIAEQNIKLRLNTVYDIKWLLNKRNVDMEKIILESSNDMHCYPNIILQLQGSIPYNPKYTTKYISGFIWNKSSKYNFRDPLSMDKINKEEEVIVKELKCIQKSYNNNREHMYKINLLNDIELKPNSIPDIIKNNIQYQDMSRLGFLLIFGQKFKVNSEGKNKPSLEIIIAGDPDKPCRIKKYGSEKYAYLEGLERYEGEKRFMKQIMDKGLYINIPNPPAGYKWKINNRIKISGKIISSDCNKFINKIQFYVDNIPVASFDSKLLMENLGCYKEIVLEDKNIIRIIENAVYKKSDIGGFELNMIMRKLGMSRRETHDFRVFDILPYIYNKYICTAWNQLYSRIIMNNIVEIGPVDRMGDKMQNSVSYSHEGIFWRLMNLLYMLYPETVTLIGEYRYGLNINTPSYINMISMIKQQINREISVKDVYMGNITVGTKLWTHQEKTVKHIFNGMLTSNMQKGFGDASHVGAGKTLTALGIMAKLYEYNKNNINNINNIGNGFLILVPNIQLYSTWKDEIDKHTTGFEYIFQNANGTMDIHNSSIADSKSSNIIKSNTIIITTMGRIREHPIINRWILVIIDECLTVQNKEALQTEEALRQTALSQYNVILMSANFFRSRFDKLFYMLKMLKTGLPEKSEFLDVILSESLVCNISESGRKWINNVNKFELNSIERKHYGEIQKMLSKNDYEKTYMLLSKFINDKCNYEKYFIERIKQIELTRADSKILIYAKSKNEADMLSKHENIDRYPNIGKKHVVVSYAEGTFGLNNLVEYNTILTRPPNADYVPQMKGRLDRSGQKTDILYLEYILLKDTIEEVELIKLEYSNHFHNSYIMPLAEYYKVAVDYK